VHGVITPPHRLQGSGWASNGLEGMTVPVFHAAAATFQTVKISSSPASPVTAGMPNIWSRRYRPSRLCPNLWTPRKAAPLLCAGLTTFNALRHTGALPGDLVALQGTGDLVISEYSLQTNLDSARWLSVVVRKMRRDCVHRQQRPQRRTGVEKNGRRTGNSYNGPQLQSDVGAYRRTSSQRFPGGGRCRDGAH
jgi:hypothetical protein